MTLSLQKSAYPSSSITFVLHDAGETRALTPVMQKLDATGVGYSILADGTAQSLLKGNPHLAFSPWETARANLINPALALQMQQRFQRALQAKVCVTGLVSDFQKQCANLFRQAGKRVVGYYDGFNYSQNPVNNRANAFQGVLTDLMTPTEEVAATFRRQGFSNIPVTAVGQPTLESIPKAIQDTQPALLAQQLGLRRDQPTFLFVGQYGPAYEQALALFCQSVRLFPPSNLLISLHPKSDGNLERRMLQQYGLEQAVHIIPKTISTEQALTVADAVLTHSSTMATQAFLQGEKVIFVGPEKPDVIEPLQTHGLVVRCQTPESLVEMTRQAIQNPPVPLNTQGIFVLLGLPAKATERITHYLLGLFSDASYPKTA